MRSGRSKPAQKVRDRSALGALRFDCDVLPARVERLKGARFRLTVFPSLLLPRSGDHHADVTTLMARVKSNPGGLGAGPPQGVVLAAPALAGLIPITG